MTDNCKHVSKIKTSIQLGILSPDRWHCNVCNTTECVWACLSCSNFACGRYISEHALDHFRSTGHPLCIEVNDKFVFCYICDDFVLNDNAPGDIKLLRMALDAVADQNFEALSKEKRGRRILRFHIRDAKRIARRLLRADDIQTAVMRHRISRLSWALRLWWTRYLEKKRLDGGNARLRISFSKSRAPLTCPPAFTGLRNLGNTCYMNSVLQVLRHTAPFANFVLNHPPSEILPSSKKRRITSQGNQDPEAHAKEYPPQCAPPAIGAPGLCGLSEPTVQLSNLSPSYARGGTSISASPDSGSVASSGVNSCSKDPKIVDPSNLGGGLNGGRCSGFPSDKGSGDINPISTMPEDVNHVDQGSVYEELYNLLKNLWSGHRTVVSPSNLVYTIWTALPSFKGYRQQDAQEFLSMFLDRLQFELHGDSPAVHLNSRDFVNRTFQGYSVSHIRCTNCNAVACTEEPFSELSLALPPSCYSGEAQECDLVDLISQFARPTPIDGKSYACRECTGKDGIVSPLTLSPAAFNNSTPRDRSASTSRGSTPYKVDKLVSVALSRLPTPSPSRSSPASRHLTFDPPSTSPYSPAYTDVNEAGDTRDEPSESSISAPSISTDKQLSHSGGVSTPTCGSPPLTSATQTIRLARLPRVLRLHIKRFRWIGRQREKLGCHVSFPLILDLSDFMLNDSDRAECSRVHAHDPSVYSNEDNSRAAPLENPRHLYHLTGVIVHHGRGFQSGHYTAYCLNDQPEYWLSCNDTNVTFCDYSEVASSQAYLLFYSELMPTSRYPNWLTASDASSLQAGLKRCYSGAFTTSTDLQKLATPTPPKVAQQSRLKRTASTPVDLATRRPSSSQRNAISGSPTKKPVDMRIRRAGDTNLRPLKTTSQLDPPA